MPISMEEFVERINSTVVLMLQKDRVNKYNDQNIIKCAYDKAFDVINKMFNDKFRGKFFKYGNLKLDANIARFTLPEVITCSTNCDYCYAKKMPYKATKVFRLSNLFVALYAIHDDRFKRKFLQVVHKELDKHKDKCKSLNKVPIFRFHDSGDIFSSGYFKLIVDIVMQNPDIKFYSYTKNKDAYEEYKQVKELLKFKNFNIVNSVIEDSVYNYFDFIHNFKYEFAKFKDMINILRAAKKRVFVCDYNFDHLFKENRYGFKVLLGYLLSNKDVISFMDKHMACGECTACCDFEYTVFIKH